VLYKFLLGKFFGMAGGGEGRGKGV
jgi:hypothetical protein